MRKFFKSIIIYIQGLFIFLGLSNIYAQDNKVTKSDLIKIEKYLTKKIDDDPQNKMFYAQRAEIKYQLADTLGALNDYLITLKLGDSLNPDRYYNIGIILSELSRYKSSLDYLTKGILLNSNKKPDLFFARGYSFQELGMLKESNKDYQKAIELNSNLIGAYNNLGRNLIKLNKNEEAIDIFSKGILKDSSHANLFYNRGSAYLNLGKNTEGLRDMELAVKKEPLNEYCYYYLGLAYFKIGKNDFGCKNWKKAKKLGYKFKMEFNEKGCER